ncbi:MAG: homoserine dehydrogenase [Anaerolineales bacterium]
MNPMTPKHYNLALLGFGNVGRALARLLERKAAEVKARYGITYTITGIATGRHGALIAPAGVDVPAALQSVESGGSLGEALPALEFICRVPADVLFENTPVNYESGEPALSHLRAALERGMHAITANKGPVVHGYHALRTLAESRGRKFYFESTVMDGAPVFALQRAALPAAQIRLLRGIFNSTTNLILTRMEEEGETFAQAVAYAQSIGIAETDPSGDVDGWDAAVKVAALVTVYMDTPFTPQMVERQGIRNISLEEVRAAQAQGFRWKLVCEAAREGDSIRARVAPKKVAPDSPLYGVRGTSSILEIESDVLGKLSLIEEDPGPHTTAYGLFADFLNAVR